MIRPLLSVFHKPVTPEITLLDKYELLDGDYLIEKDNSDDLLSKEEEKML